MVFGAAGLLPSRRIHDILEVFLGLKSDKNRLGCFEVVNVRDIYFDVCVLCVCSVCVCVCGNHFVTKVVRPI